MGITVVSVGLGMYAEEAFAELLLGLLYRWVRLSEAAAHGVAAGIALSLMTFLHVVVGEMVPEFASVESLLASLIAWNHLSWRSKSPLTEPMIKPMHKFTHFWVISSIFIPPIVETNR